MRRRNVPCSPCSGGSSGSCGCCGLKEKLRILWDRTIGSIITINGITPDGDGDFKIEAGSNIALSQVGTGNGIKIDTTGGVSYYTAGDSYIDVDNNDLEISLVNPGQTGGVALHDDLALVADAVSDILDGTTTIPKAQTANSLALAGMDSTPTNGSNKAVTSDGIYNALAITFGRRMINGANYPTFADFFNAIASTIEGKPYILKYFDNSSGNFVCLNGVGDTVSYMGVGGTCYISSVYYQANRIQFNGSGAYLYRLNSSFSESVYTLDYTKFKIYY